MVELANHFRTAIGACSVVGLLLYPLPVAWSGLLGLLLLALERWRRRGWPLPASPLLLPLGLYLAGAAVGLSAAVHPHSGEIRLFGLLAAAGASWLILDRVRSLDAASRLVDLLLLGMLLAAPFLLVLVAPALQLDRFPSPLRPLLGAMLPLAKPLRQAFQEVGNLSQRYELYPSGLGTFAAYGVGLALGPLLAGTSQRRRLLGGLAAGYFGLVLLFSANRGALLGALLVSALLAATRYRRLLLAVPILAVGMLLVVSFPTRLASDSPLRRALAIVPAAVTDPGPIYVRMEYWRNALFLLGDFRYTGVGLGLRSAHDTYDTYFLTGEDASAEDLPILEKDFRLPHVHNIFLQSYLEQGLLGLAGLLGLVLTGAVVGGRTLLGAQDSRTRSVALSAGGAALALVLAGLLDNVAMTTVGTLMLCGALALLVCVGRLDARGSLQGPDRREGVGRLVAGPMLPALLALLVALLLALSRGSAPLPAHPIEAGRTLVSSLFLNLGALEVDRLKLDETLGRRERDQRLASARSFLEQARELAPDDPAIYRLLAEWALTASDRSTALRMLAEASARASPGDSQLFFQLGRLYREAGDVERSLVAWSQVDPAFGSAGGAGPAAQLQLWGKELVQRGRWEAAIEVNRAAIRAAPGKATPYRGLATALERQRGEPAAFTELNELARAYPGTPWPYEELARLADHDGRAAEAEAWRQQARAAGSRG